MVVVGHSAAPALAEFRGGVRLISGGGGYCFGETAPALERQSGGSSGYGLCWLASRRHSRAKVAWRLDARGRRRRSAPIDVRGVTTERRGAHWSHGAGGRRARPRQRRTADSAGRVPTPTV
ncbi:extensin [Iris pallida]|uniref:Extensin n=1 Tax=Iris pallida TaxID=29817 RepID=A0AAX6I7R3_IRIPA|nr:extensin [Iris pallida]KAJ6849078.1 extensin [Iris pallida]